MASEDSGKAGTCLRAVVAAAADPIWLFRHCWRLLDVIVQLGRA